MRRRQALALGAAAVSFAGCIQTGAGDGAEGVALTPAATDGSPSPTGAVNRSSTATPQTHDAAVTPSVSGTLNGRPYRLGDDLALVEKSNTTWLHAFLDVRGKYIRDVTPRDDPDIGALRRASRDAGADLFVSLQWDFAGLFGKKAPKHLPPSGSSRERALIEYATELLAAIDQPVDVIGLGNEPIWETLNGDLVGPDASLVPFTRKLKDHLVEHYTGGDPRFVLGAFNRLYSDRILKKYEDFYRQLLELARTDDEIDGIDLHVHYVSLQQAETMLDMARRAFPDGMITATEFSPVWRYVQHSDEPITEFEGGKRFADRYGIPEDTTVTEYFEAAKDDRIARSEIAGFMETMPWYNVDFVEDMYDLLRKYGVEIGTICFLVDEDVRNVDWTEEWVPFPINCLFQPALIDSEDGAHPHYLDDFRNRT